jgi:hypothetical protein
MLLRSHFFFVDNEALAGTCITKELLSPPFYREKDTDRAQPEINPQQCLMDTHSHTFWFFSSRKTVKAPNCNHVMTIHKAGNASNFSDFFGASYIYS